MKTRLFSLLALGTVACQQHSPATTQAPQASQAAAIPDAAVEALHEPAQAEPAPDVAANDPAPTEAKEDITTNLLKRFDLSPVLQIQANERAMNGFYGPDRYRMEVVLTHVTRDPDEPGRYLVQGKDRYKNVITPFKGFIRFERILTIDDAQSNSKIYSFSGIYQLKEDSTAKGAGIFSGRIAADVALDDHQKLVVVANEQDMPSKGAGILYSGYWEGLANAQTKDATWVRELFGYRGPEIVQDFWLGERDQNINPKYAKKGWNKYWENDEWWAESPGAVASSQPTP